MTRIRVFFLQIRAFLYDDFLTRAGTPSPSPFSYAPASTARIYLCQQQEDRRCKVCSKLTIKTLEWRYWGNMKTPTWEIATRMIPTRQFPPRKLPPKEIPTQDKSTWTFPTQENSHSENSHPDNSHPENSHPDNSHLENCHRIIPT